MNNYCFEKSLASLLVLLALALPMLFILVNDASAQVATLNPEPDYESGYRGSYVDFHLGTLVSVVIVGFVYYVISQALLEVADEKMPDITGLLGIILIAGFLPAIALAAVFPFYVIGGALLIWGIFRLNSDNETSKGQQANNQKKSAEGSPKPKTSTQKPTSQSDTEAQERYAGAIPRGSRDNNKETLITEFEYSNNSDSEKGNHKLN